MRNLAKTFRELPGNGQDQGLGFWKLLVRDEKISEFKIEADGEAIEGKMNQSQCQFVQLNAHQGKSLPVVCFDPSWQPSVRRVQGSLRLSILSTKQADPSSVSELYNQIAPLNPENETNLEKLLSSSIEPRLRRLRYAKLQGTQTHLVYVDLGEGPMLPFTQLGQAFARTLQIYCEIFANCPKILLIDEIENGLYYEGMEDFWKGLMAVLEDQDVQLFATTHSRECMEAAQRAADTIAGDPLRFLRLDRRVDDPGKIVATTFGKEEMRTAMEFNREMR